MLAWKTANHVREDKFGEKPPRHGIAVRHWRIALKGKVLESVANGVAEVQRLANACFKLVGLHKTLLDFD